MEYQSGAVSPGGSISEGWNIIKDNYWMFVLMILVMVVIYIALAFVLGLISAAITTGISAILGIATQGSGDAAKFSAALIPQIISLIISIFTNLIMFVIIGILSCGIYKGISRVANGGAADFGDLFSEFDKAYPCLVVAVIMSLIQFVVGIVLVVFAATVGFSAVGLSGILVKDGQINPAIFGGLMLGILGFVVASLLMSLVIHILTDFVYPLISERNASGGEAIMLSIKAGLSNFFGLAGLFILLFFMLLGGALVCGIGALFVAPILFAAVFAAYRSVFGAGGGTFQSAPPPPPVFNQPGY